MPIKIYKYILMRFLPSFGVGAAVFTSLLLMNQTSRQVEQLAPHAGGIGQFLISFLLLAPPFLSYSIALAFLMAMISTLNEMKRDQELQAMFVSGISPLSVLLPYLAAAVGVSIITMMTTVYLTPFSFRTYNDRIIQMARNQILNDLRPGAFFKGIPNSILLVGAYDPDAGELGGLLLVREGTEEETDLILASSGTVRVPDAGEPEIRFDLLHGTVHPVSASEPGYRTAAFDHLTSRIESHDPGATVRRKHILMGSSMGELESIRRDWLAEGKISDAARVMIEVHRRFSFPAALLIYPFIIYPMAISSRKLGKAAAFSSSVILFLLGTFLFSLGSRLGVQGRISAELAAWFPVIVLGLIALGTFVPFAVKQALPGNASRMGHE